MTYYYIAYMPFYNYKVAVLQSQLIAVLSWCTICLAIAYYDNNPKDPGPTVLFYIGSIFVWILTKEICDWWRQKLVEKDIATVKNPYQVELHTRFMILNRAGTYKTDDQQVLTEAEDFYYQAERKFPESSLLKIFVAQFHLTYRNRQEAIPKLEQAEMRSPALDEQFIIYKTRQNVGKDVITMVTFTSYLESSGKAEILALKYQQQFWKALASKNVVSDDVLIYLSKNITKNIDLAFHNYKFMLSVDRTHVKMVPMYVYFMEDVMQKNDDDVKNLNNRLRDMNNGQNSGKVINSKFELQPRMSIALGKNNFGIIDKVNTEMTTWIKVPKAKIINQKVISLMPYYYGHCFLAYLNEMKDNYDEAMGPPPVELYFLDDKGLLLGCTCDFILESEDPMSKTQTKTTHESTLAVDARGSSFYARSVVTGTGGKMHEWHKPIKCVLVPHDPSECVIFLTSDYLLMNYNNRASSFFGINSEMIGTKNIKEFISNFEDLLEKAKKHMDMSSGMLVEFTPVQTFLISNSGTFSRIRVSISSYCVDNNIYYILTITEPGSYSKPTQKFFSLFIKFLEVYMKKEGHIEEAQDNAVSQATALSEEKRIHRLLQRVHRQVEAKNSCKSPELVSLSRLMWVFMILMMGVFGGSYAVSVMAFENYVFYIRQIEVVSEIRVESSMISTYLIMLDMARQGFQVPEPTEQLIYNLTYIADDLFANINYISKTNSFSELNLNTLACVSFKFMGGYEVVYLNLIDAVMQQSTYTLKLIDQDMSNFDILNNSYAFWCYFNGNKAIRQSLDELSQRLRNAAEDSREAIGTWAYTFASMEIGLIFAVMCISLPLILKSEQLNMKIIRVFSVLSDSILSYLQKITKICLEMRQDVHYPDNRSRYQSAEDLWEEFLVEQEQKRRSSAVGLQEKVVYEVTFWKQVKAFCKNSFTRRLMIFCLLSAAVSWVLQTYVGVIVPTLELNGAANIIKISGLIEVMQAQASTSLISEIISPLEVYTNQTAQLLYKDINSTDLLTYPSTENSYWDTVNNTNYLKIYMSMLMIGNQTAGITYDKVWTLQVNQFLSYFIPSTCPNYIHDCSFYGGVVAKGYLYSVQTSIIDTMDIANEIYNNKNSSIPDRIAAVSDRLLPLLVLQYHYINITSYNIENMIIGYFASNVTYYNFIQEIVLIIYYAFCVSYMIFIFRRTLKHHEKKKKMARSMLLLIPFRVVKYSKHIQKVLENMDYD